MTTPKCTDAMIRRAYRDLQIGKKWSVAEVARHVGLSRSSYNRRRLGLGLASPHRDQTKAAIARAANARRLAKGHPCCGSRIDIAPCFCSRAAG